MNFRDLEYFVQLTEDRNYTKTAQHFAVSQPTITYAVKRLEAELGVPLFIRDQSHHQLDLTLAGQEFGEHAKAILQELVTAKADIVTLTQQKIRFGLPPIIGTYYFPQLAKRLIQQNLMSHLQTFEAGSATLQQQLQSGEIDVALLGTVDPIEMAQIKTITLAKTDFKIIVSPKHDLQQQTAIKFAELKKEPFITLKEGFVHPAAFRKLAAINHFEPQIAYTTPDINVLKGMVHENVGISFLTELALKDDQSVHTINLTDKNQPHFDIVLAYRPQVNPLMEKLIDELQQPINL
ncbi:malolactic fermentation transcriptional regulator [Paucilactobacillus hokkaidonensis JCM 18461]|uniref:Malolactic fermentation transcriptional regulator n=2 Tax=Paucilactobacillus hokkaidonensis TaxID=1193095 RepID=A0A0A1GWD7_9LACO|nr:LysR family transcriptional regulator [Paucilactobacillus hokkaidonensis]KRO09495.1 LysR family transcriptional regulator [Paucilactobacillus hokkaidonensis]BAP84671.1 malolactic fermentation transcriptional regulator [Paucilactobacillus hokkaidonensis JCM 18461]